MLVGVPSGVLVKGATGGMMQPLNVDDPEFATVGQATPPLLLPGAGEEVAGRIHAEYVRMVEHVGGLGEELEADLLADREGARDAHIQIVEAGTFESIAADLRRASGLEAPELELIVPQVSPGSSPEGHGALALMDAVMGTDYGQQKGAEDAGEACNQTGFGVEAKRNVDTRPG